MSNAAEHKVKQATAITLLLVAAIFSVNGRAMSASKNGAVDRYCKPQPVGGIVQPLNSMPGRKPVPAYVPLLSGRQLPFGPRMLRIGEVGTLVGDRILTSRGRYGYDFYLPLASARFGWQVVLSGFAVDKRGHTTRGLGVIRRRIGKIGGIIQPRVTLRIPGEEGFYRADLLIRNRKGEVLGKFREYLRVLEPTMSVRLSTSASTVLPGSQILARIENIGTIPVQFGAPYSVQYYDGTTWIHIGPEQEMWPRDRRGLGAGEAGNCMQFTLPKNAAPGRYRFVKRINEYEDLEHEQILYGEFSVVAP